MNLCSMSPSNYYSLETRQSPYYLPIQYLCHTGEFVYNFLSCAINHFCSTSNWQFRRDISVSQYCKQTFLDITSNISLWISKKLLLLTFMRPFIFEALHFQNYEKVQNEKISFKKCLPLLHILFLESWQMLSWVWLLCCFIRWVLVNAHNGWYFLLRFFEKKFSHSGS